MHYNIKLRQGSILDLLLKREIEVVIEKSEALSSDTTKKIDEKYLEHVVLQDIKIRSKGLHMTLFDKELKVHFGCTSCDTILIAGKLGLWMKLTSPSTVEKIYFKK